ncbi:MAG: TIM barrel protein [Candidatus Latescibacteria bacterium]|nr:TIM barrel protein [Candidatus Latescibacterota bacterium]
MTNFTLTGFADEISPDPNEQIAVLKETGVGHIELRGIDGKNVLDLSPAEAEAFRRDLQRAGIGVSAIGSPIGKVQIRSDLEAHFARFQVAVERAAHFATPNIRLFSFYYEGEEPAAVRGEIIALLRRMAEYAAAAGCTLLHENESRIYGDTTERCLDLLGSIDHPAFRGIFDPSNFVQCGVDTRQAWHELAGYVDYFHIKDSLAATRKVVPAGYGDGHVAWILGQALERGFSGFLSLEPHLAADDPVHGGSGAERFAKAVDALRQVLAGLE